mmetsp:Transcript_7201/g.30663  ORF Transcript_7201/g.30663 Transcript_7201/m.30663 type:complete len:244 (-) Transcript_7201:735-1466(-)
MRVRDGRTGDGRLLHGSDDLCALPREGDLCPADARHQGLPGGGPLEAGGGCSAGTEFHRQQLQRPLLNAGGLPAPHGCRVQGVVQVRHAQRRRHVAAAGALLPPLPGRLPAEQPHLPAAGHLCHLPGRDLPPAAEHALVDRLLQREADLLRRRAAGIRARPQAARHGDFWQPQVHPRGQVRPDARPLRQRPLDEGWEDCRRPVPLACRTQRGPVLAASPTSGALVLPSQGRCCVLPVLVHDLQ